MVHALGIGLLVVACSHDMAAADILPPERRTTWAPGVPGGIPMVTGPVVGVLDHGADPAGVKDSKAAFDAAVAALPRSGGVVWLPPGQYRLRSKWTIGRSGIVVRGAGSDQTRLLADHTGVCIEVITFERGAWQPLAGGYDKGWTTFVVADTSRFFPGRFAEVEQDNDPARMYTKPAWNQPWAANAAGQLFEVSSVAGNQLRLKTPLHFSLRPDLNPRVRPQGLVTRTGFEEFHIRKLQSGEHTFLFKNTAYCWVRAIESDHTRRSHISSEATLGNEYRDSTFHHSFSYGDGGSGYGVEFGLHSTDGLCENNVFHTLRHAMMVHLGAVGCVFGYNYSFNPVQGEGEKDLNQGWVPPDLSLHGHWAQMNLFEGNVVQEIQVADYWGPMGPGNTFLRNQVQGDRRYQEGILLRDHSHGQNFIGSVMPWWHTDGTSTNTLRHGEQVAGRTYWQADITHRVLPPSYYRAEKPSFFGPSPWPATGSDLTKAAPIPAQLRAGSN